MTIGSRNPTTSLYQTERFFESWLNKSHKKNIVCSQFIQFETCRWDFPILPWSRLHLCAQSFNPKENILESPFEQICNTKTFFLFPYKQGEGNCLLFCIYSFQRYSLHTSFGWTVYCFQGLVSSGKASQNKYYGDY